jgi:UDP-N-acetylmuramoyl-tripeptide--D-alanyl-D-alanine ligase
MKLGLGQIAEWIDADGSFDPLAEAIGYSIDSRSISDGDLFFAIRGKQFDGHDYVEDALINGAVAAVVVADWMKPASVSEKKVLRLRCCDRECIIQAMQQLARQVRRRWGRQIIGVTGSAGKTTTKEFIAMVLGARYNVLSSEGNRNNYIGMPLQLLRLEPEHEVAVLELGMNHTGEIRALATIAAPNWGVVTNVSEAHIEHFTAGLEGIARAKYELVEALPTEGIAVLNADDPRVCKFRNGMAHRAILYGTKRSANVRAIEIKDLGIAGTEFVVESSGLRHALKMNMLGRHNILNALAAIAVGLQSGLSLSTCCSILSKATSGYTRGHVSEWNGARIINDCYNSNPAALISMMESLSCVGAKRRILVAGEMLELGTMSAVLHAKCGEAAAEAGITFVLGVAGKAERLVASALGKGVRAEFVETPEEAGKWLAGNVQPGDVVLLKGSRGVHLERALEELKFT